MTGLSSFPLLDALLHELVYLVTGFVLVIQKSREYHGLDLFESVLQVPEISKSPARPREQPLARVEGRNHPADDFRVHLVQDTLQHPLLALNDSYGPFSGQVAFFVIIFFL